MHGVEEYYLMHKNSKVAKFSMTDYGTDIKVIEIYDEKLMPYGTHVETRTLNEKFAEWKNERRIPTDRPYIMQIYKKTGKSMPELETQNLGLSLCDCYWYQTIDSDYDWRDINFYKNPVKNHIGKMLMNINNDTPEDTITPDITLSGECPKTWMRHNGTLYLVKGCRLYSDTKQEVCNEVFASLLAEKLGIPTVQYYMMRSGEKFDFCCAETFIKDDTIEFVSFKQISNDTETLGINGVMKFMDKHNLTRYKDGLIIIDFLIGNYNRTLSDIGIIVDSETLQFIAPAPIFDYEESLDFNLYDDDIIGVFHTELNEQIKMVSDFRWIDFDIMDDIADEIDRIYSLGGFKNQDIKQIKDYFKKRVNALRKFIPPEQLQKKKAINIVPKPVKEEVKEDIIRIHIYDNKEETDNIERNALYEEDDNE